MRGLALEGGGARGAYHIGVVKALLENGYDFDGFVGTSIGAINAAALAQGDFNKIHDSWSNISPDQLFDDDEQRFFNYIDAHGFRLNTEFSSTIKKMLLKMRSGGIGTEKIKAFMKAHISEEVIRKSGKDFGLVTVSLTSRKPFEMMLEDIPDGQLIDYIMASASLPGFRRERIEGNTFIDGAFYDSCPFRLLLDRGYDEIIAVRTNSLGVFRRIEDAEKVKVIAPKTHLGRVLVFTPEHAQANISLGYDDGLQFLAANPLQP